MSKKSIRQHAHNVYDFVLSPNKIISTYLLHPVCDNLIVQYNAYHINFQYFLKTKNLIKLDILQSNINKLKDYINNHHYLFSVNALVLE